MPGTLNYGARSFDELREQAFTHIEHYYPQLLSDFSDGSLGTMLIEIVAAAQEGLEYRLDRTFQETQRLQAQQRSSLVAMADNMGVRLPGKRAAVTLAEFTVTVPVAGDAPAADYMPVLRAGAQITGGGRTFETLYDVDFASEVSAHGFPNRRYIPRFDAGGRVVSYDVTKTEIVVNGLTRRLKVLIGATEAKPFYQLTLPDPDVLSVTRVVNIPGLASGTEESLLTDPTAREFREVDYLAQPHLFLADPIKSAAAGGPVGRWTPVYRKFLTRYDNRGRLQLTFGGGGEVGDFIEQLGGEDSPQGSAVKRVLGTTALGERVLPGSTLVVEYRTGGGTGSNVGPGVLTGTGRYVLLVDGPDASSNDAVRRTLRVNNPLPAMGGVDEPSLEELRYLLAPQNGAQYRAVTVPDYLAQSYNMPGRFGAPTKLAATLEDNILVLYVLGSQADGQLTNQSLSLMKDNLGEYLVGVRGFNDSVLVRDGRIYHLAYDIEVLVGDGTVADVTTGVVKAVADFHNPRKAVMGGLLALSPLYEAINNLPAVTNIQKLRIFNKVGGEYSANRAEHPLLDASTGELDISENLLQAGADGVFALKDARRDVRVTIKRVRAPQA